MDNSSTYLRQASAEPTLFLVESARVGSEWAWRELYRRYHTMLVVQIQSRIPGFARRRFDAEDVLQDAFYKAWAHLEGYLDRGEGSFRRWLATLVFREFQNELRSQFRERDKVYVRDESTEDLTIPDPTCPETSQVLSKMALYDQLGRLDEVDRDILIMRTFEELSFERIGEALECSKKHAQTLYNKALGRLKRLMG